MDLHRFVIRIENVILFFISFILIFSSSYFLSSAVDKYSETKTKPFFVYLLLTAFAQIILSFEILSLFNGINQINFLIINTLFLAVSFVLIKRTGTQIYKPQIGVFLFDVKKALIKDKLLFIPLCAFLLDAMSYHVPRAVNWIVNGSLEHYPYIDMRMLTMPINSELIFAWIILFFKSDVALGMVPFFGFVNTVVVLYCLLGELGFCIRKRLWTVFVFSSLAFVVIETTTCDTNMFTGSLILTAMYLFYCAAKYKKNILLFVSALALAISCGVKTTAIIALPSAALCMIMVAVSFEGKKFYKTLLKFVFFFLVNFLIFSSYNYILNFINYNDFVTTQTQYELNRFRGGKKAYISNLIKYGFMLFDFSGISYMERFTNFANQLKEVFHLMFGMHASTYFSAPFADKEPFSLNSTLIETRVGMGLIGILAFFPSVFRLLFKSVKSKRKNLIKTFALMYVLNILIFAGVMIYTGYNSRYLTTFAVISSPVLVFTYFKSWKNIYKWLLIITMCYYLMFASLKNPYRYVSKMTEVFKKTGSISALRSIMRSNVVNYSENELNYSRLAEYIQRVKPKNVGIAFDHGDFILPLAFLRLYGCHIDYLNLEDMGNSRLSDYDMLVFHTVYQQSDNIKHYYSDDNTLELSDGRKVYFDENNKITCYYVDVKLKISDKNSEDRPIYVRCLTPREQLDELNYYQSEFFPSDDIQGDNKVNNKDLVVYQKREQ